jgi:hypothetical protein
MSCHCCYTIFWTALYNSPCTFCLANYSVMFRDLCCPASFPTAPLTTNIAYKPLVATLRTNTLPFLIPINWTGFAVKSTPLVTFHLLTFPFRAFKQTFFPQLPASLLPPPVAE